jgi:hypothetical protein
MAKQTGLVKYSGTMGGVRHFKIKGLAGDFAGMVGGPSGDQILRDIQDFLCPHTFSIPWHITPALNWEET